ncbi:3-hydroxyacyl-ACP dehydratase FabZ [Paenibacillus alvei]|uniref:3-hydroxyacyl-ACP dehydratase FabZ n=1 Tax=Paenibacillus alvei TaxID=44250 RepID=UPI0003856CD9|nr:3-hydroxyacyl-ACP dehydratase FabZ [Paenibacillus alvei]EPY14033.1 3-hydroxyacyl-(acyl-carrier-protein) dehydratase [Paenibacillus alvei A6-6i-x]
MKTIEINKVISHKYPFILVDRILEIDYMKSSKGLKNISSNEPWAMGHFPEEPIYPGVLIIETMGQVGGFMFYNADENTRPEKMYLSGVNNIKLIRPVVPGDVLVVEAELYESFAHLFQIKCTAKVDNQIAASGILTLAKLGRDSYFKMKGSGGRNE